MSNREKIEQLRRNSDWFLKSLAIQVCVIGRENWQGLNDDVHNDEVLPFLAGLTHKDYVDGPNLWSAISDQDTLLKYVVMTEGFSGGISKVRDIVANMMAESLPVSRHSTSVQEMRNIQAQRNQDSAVAVFLTGNRSLTSPLKPGIQLMLDKKDTLYPFVNLSDTKPAFPSGSTFGKNVGELLSRTIFNRQNSTEYLYLLKPITNEGLEEMKEGKKGKEGRKVVIEKLEVIRAYNVLKTLVEVAKLNPGVINPLFLNEDNLPLLVKSQHVLSENTKSVQWLLDHRYFLLNEIGQFVSIKL